MPRREKGPRLWLQPARQRDGAFYNSAVWVIRHGTRKISTGCGPESREEAELALTRYRVEIHDPASARARADNDPLIADMISLWLDARAAAHARPRETAARAARLLAFWSTRRASDITGANCRAYGKGRTDSAVRRELQDLRAACRHAWQVERIIDHPVPVPMPGKGASRQEWLTRDEAAGLIRAAWRMRQRFGGEPTPRATGRHVARFILVALYTGTRAGAVCGAAIRPTIGSPYVDLEQGVFHRRAPGAAETKKRRPSIRLPARLLAHLRRWERLGISNAFVVEWNGRPVARIHKAFRAARTAAGLPATVTPHVLRHTAASWGMQNLESPGDIFDLADYLGMTVKVLLEVYGHHNPEHQRAAIAAIGRRPGAAQPAGEQSGPDRQIPTETRELKGNGARRKRRI